MTEIPDLTFNVEFTLEQALIVMGLLALLLFIWRAKLGLELIGVRAVLRKAIAELREERDTFKASLEAMQHDYNVGEVVKARQYGEIEALKDERDRLWDKLADLETEQRDLHK